MLFVNIWENLNGGIFWTHTVCNLVDHSWRCTELFDSLTALWRWQVANYTVTQETRAGAYLRCRVNSLSFQKETREMLQLKCLCSVFSARQRICLARYNYAIARPSLRLQSVCPSGTRVDQSKTVEVRIVKFLPYDSAIPLVFAG